MKEHHRLLERQGVPDLHLAVGPLQYTGRKELVVGVAVNLNNNLLMKAEPAHQNEGGCLLNALQHAILGQIICAVVVPHMETPCGGRVA